jgi:uncharacterized protein
VSVVVSLHRYPVKSLLGESLSQAAVTERGIEGDRVGAFLAGNHIASAKQVRRWGRLLQLAATYDGDVLVHFPDGQPVARSLVDVAVSDFIGQSVRYIDRRPATMVIERTPLLPGDPNESVLAHAAPAGGFFDYAPLHLISTVTLSSLGDAEAARFRPNILLDGPEPDVGAVVHVGSEVAVRILTATPRCAVPQLQHGAVPPAPGLLQRLPRTDLGLCAGVYAEVVTGGLIRTGDPARPA